MRKRTVLGLALALVLSGACAPARDAELCVDRADRLLALWSVEERGGCVWRGTYVESEGLYLVSALGETGAVNGERELRELEGCFGGSGVHVAISVYPLRREYG